MEEPKTESESKDRTQFVIVESASAEGKKKRVRVKKKKKKRFSVFFFPRLSLKLLGFHRPVRSRNQNNPIKSKGSSRLPYARQEEWEVFSGLQGFCGY